MRRKLLLAGVMGCLAITLANVPVPAEGKPKKKAKPAIKLSLFHTGFDVAPLTWRDDDVVKGAWTQSTKVMPKDTITVVVVATWCGYSDKFMKTLRTDAAVRGGVDAVLVYENDAAVALQHAVASGEISADKSKEYAELLAAADQFLFEPDFFDPERGVDPTLDPKTLPPPTPVYVIREDKFTDVLTSVPTAFRCDGTGCRKTSLPAKAKPWAKVTP